jgi:anti-sigma regulatory factor (Ser/Thr protein kinase)
VYLGDPADPSTPGYDAEARMLERHFGADALAELRKAVLGYATASGLSEDRAFEVMLAAHELAANAVLHGPGRGRLRMEVTASILRCEVSDPGAADGDGHVPGRSGGQVPRVPGAAPWPVEQGHGLWLVRQAADHVRFISGPHGSLITAEFVLPATAEPLPQARRLDIPGGGTSR